MSHPFRGSERIELEFAQRTRVLNSRAVEQLEPCPRCARHVRVSSARCPFCDGALEFEVSPPLLPNRRLSRFEFVSWKTLVGAGVIGGSISTFAGACAVYGAPMYGAPCGDDCFPPAPDASDASSGGTSAAGRSGVGGAAGTGGATSSGGAGGAASTGGAGGVAGTGASDGGNAGGAGGEQGGEGGA